jgi:hypothetical protein
LKPWYLIPRDTIPRFQWHRWIRFRGTLRQWNLYKNVHVGSFGLIETAEFDLCKRLSRISRQIPSKMHNILARSYIGSTLYSIWVHSVYVTKYILSRFCKIFFSKSMFVWMSVILH